MAIGFVLAMIVGAAGAILLALSFVWCVLKKIIFGSTEATTKFQYEKLSWAEEKLFSNKRCPDCGGELWVGPRSGMSVKYLCGSLSCGSHFSYDGPFGIVRMTDASPRRVVDIANQELGPYRTRK